MSIAGVVLAAGSSSRLGEAKQLVRDATGEVLVHRAARLLLDAGCTPVFVVVGAHYEDVVPALSPLAVIPVLNTGWQEGIASSIRAAVSAAREFQHDTGIVRGETLGADSGNAAFRAQHATAIDALLLATCDMPTVDVDHLRRLCEAFTGGATRVASAYGTAQQKTVGIPAIVGAREWPALLALQGDRGAKALFAARETAAVWLEGGSFDLDTPTDLEHWSGA